MKVNLFATLLTAMLVAGAYGSPLAAQSKPEESTKQLAPQTSTRIRVGERVMVAKLIHKVPPKYPKEAKRKRIQGTVRLHATIGKDGKIEDLQLLAGDPLLAASALRAVKKWRYMPTLVNGQPVKLETEIDVNFRLD